MIGRRSSAPLWFKLSALAWGILVLFWLPVEDLDLRWVNFFAAALCALTAARYIIPSPELEHNDRYWWSCPLIAALAGLCVAPLAVFLMIFKSGLHGHPSPDFSPAQVASVLYRTPYWVAGGFMVGLGFGLFRKVNRSST